MTKAEELVDLIGRAQRGEQAAFAAIVERFQDMAYGYAYAILGDFPLAEDAAQEAFVEAFYALPNLREARAFPAWFKRVVFKHCDRLRRGKRPTIYPLETGDEVASPAPGPDEIAEQKEAGSRVQEAIGSLPLTERVATTLFYINGYSQQEIADFLEVPAKTVKSRLHASRQRLRERMLDMVQEELNANALPEDFTRQTVEQAVARAKELNKDHQFDQAEQILRQALVQAPGHTGALKELNRAVMRGQVYAHGRWDLLPELARQGQTILSTSDDEEVFRELAQTLLAIPAMPEAITFLEGWIAKKGPKPERLGMLAWAKGCVANYESAEALWQEYLGLARQAKPEETVDSLRFVCYTLVDCLAKAGETERAQRIARQGWELSRQWADVACKEAHNDWYWLMLFKHAKLDYRDVAQALLAYHAGKPEPEAQGAALSIRAYIDEPQAVKAGWMEWVRKCIKDGEWKLMETFRGSIMIPLRQMRRCNEQVELAQAIWELLRDIPGKEAERARKPWSWERFNYFCHLEAEEWEVVEDIARRAIEEGEFSMGATGLLLAAAKHGMPTPQELVQAVEQKGVEIIDDYGLFGWYLVAREAAAAGDAAKALDALRKTVGYWSNSPTYFLKLMENDAYWGELRQHTEFKRIFAEKRERIGPIYGMLHYFPGW